VRLALLQQLLAQLAQLALRVLQARQVGLGQRALRADLVLRAQLGLLDLRARQALEEGLAQLAQLGLQAQLLMSLDQLAPQGRQGLLGLRGRLEQVFITEAPLRRLAHCLPPAMLMVMLISFLMMITFIYGMGRLGMMLARLQLAHLAQQARQVLLAF
jgi:hypothetical protein